jgi:nucleoside-diphosphate-sugar epimerase
MIFVTGGTGLIGSFLLHELRARGLPVRALHRKAVPSDAAPGVEWIAGDLLLLYRQRLRTFFIARGLCPMHHKMRMPYYK